MAEISTTSEFLNMDTSVDNKLVADLDFGGAEINAFPDYTATFDGNFHTISNVIIDYTYLGSLFSELNDATIKNLTLDNVQSQGEYIGGIVSNASGTTVIKNCKVMNVEFYLAGIENAGIVAGRLFDNSQVIDCFAEGVYSSSVNIQGMVVNVLDNASISNSFYVENYDTTDNGNGTPLTEAEAKTAQTFIDAGWDTHIWKLEDGKYPILEYTPQYESNGINIPLQLDVSSQTVLERLSDGSMVDISVDVNSQILLEKFSDGSDVNLDIDINSQTLLEKYKNGENINIGIGVNSQTLLEKIKDGSNIDLNIDINSQQLEVIQKGSKVELQIYVSKRRRILLIREEVLLADLERGVVLEAGTRNLM